MLFPKPKTPRDKKYLKWISTLPCIFCNKPGPSDPHHTESGGISLKGSDYSCIPVCGGIGGCHNRIHTTTGKAGGLGKTALNNILDRLNACYSRIGKK